MIDLIDLKPLIPEMSLIGIALLVLMIDLFSKRRSASLPAWLSMFGLVITGALLYHYQGGEGLWNGMFVSDSYANFFKIIFLGAAFFAIGSSFGTVERMTHHRGEYFALILFSTSGMMFLVSSLELITLYIGLELTTIPLFVLAAYHKTNRGSSEAGLKYLIIGAASSALLLYGFSIVYGLAGSTFMHQITINLSLHWLAFGDVGPGFTVALMLIVAGLAFKLAIVPFHMWAPDVYEGAPTPITAFLSVASKAAGLAAFVRLFCGTFIAFATDIMAPRDWGTLVAFLAAITMILGNVIAIRQTNIKRMLAYSSIAQAGYIMVGVVAASKLGVASVSFYAFAYLFANMGAFAIVTLFAERTGSEQIADYAGFSKSSPVLAILMTVFMLSLAGIPPLAGFLAKYYVFAAAIQAGYTWLVILAVLTTVVALYYYANVIRLMYLVPDTNPHHIIPSFPAGLVLLLTAVGVVIFGILPQSMLELAIDAASSFAF
jgi:NADH-quinone oxidoreductase subunit N